MAKASKPSQQQVELLHHTLGLSIDRRESYRNYFVAGPGHHDMPDLEALEALGLMTRSRAPKFCADGDIVFRATDAGRAVALDSLPPPPKRTRYGEWLDADCCESFGEFLCGSRLPTLDARRPHRTERPDCQVARQRPGSGIPRQRAPMRRTHCRMEGATGHHLDQGSQAWVTWATTGAM